MWKLFHASFDLLIRSRQENWVYRPVSLQHWPGLAIDVGAQDISTRTAERLRSHLLGCSHKRAPNLKEFNAKELFPKHYIYIYICMLTLGWLKRGQFRWIWNTWVSANIKVLFSVTAHGILQTRGRTSGQSVPACTSKIPAGIHWECSAKEKLQYPYVYILYIPCML